MIPEFSIRHLKSEELLKVRQYIESYTSAKVEEYLLAAMDNRDLETYIDGLNAINYFTFKTMLIMASQIKILQKENKKFRN